MVWLGVPNLGVNFLYNKLSLWHFFHTPLKFVIEMFDCRYSIDVKSTFSPSVRATKLTLMFFISYEQYATSFHRCDFKIWGCSHLKYLVMMIMTDSRPGKAWETHDRESAKKILRLESEALQIVFGSVYYSIRTLSASSFRLLSCSITSCRLLSFKCFIFWCRLISIHPACSHKPGVKLSTLLTWWK